MVSIFGVRKYEVVRLLGHDKLKKHHENRVRKEDRVLREGRAIQNYRKIKIGKPLPSTSGVVNKPLQWYYHGLTYCYRKAVTTATLYCTQPSNLPSYGGFLTIFVFL